MHSTIDASASAVSAANEFSSEAFSACHVMLTATGDILEPPPQGGWEPERLCNFLEQGGILYFPSSPFQIPEEELDFLRSQKQLESAYHKNISYHWDTHQLKGIKQDETDVARIQAIIELYCRQVIGFLNNTLKPYAQHYTLDYASYRPLEEKGRKLRLRARNDLIHVDSFPTRPNYGNRILRVFTNINPTEERVWRTSYPFDVLAHQFIDIMPTPGKLLSEPPEKGLKPLLAKIASKFGLKQVGLSGYDKWMTDFHNTLKADQEFQESCWTTTWSFPPGSAWVVMTDVVSHSVLSGQYALEQTAIVGLGGMVTPEVAPFNVLKAIYKL